MLNRLISMLFAFMLFVSTILVADDNTKLLIHGTGSGSVTVNGWVIGTNPGRDAQKWFFSAGPRVSSKKGSLELNAGVLVVNSQPLFVSELRASFSHEGWGFFINPEWISPGTASQSGYLFFQVNRTIGGKIKLGLETEDVWKRGSTVLTAGPQITVVLWKHTSVVSSYQFTNQKEDHLWIRMVFSF